MKTKLHWSGHFVFWMTILIFLGVYILNLQLPVFYSNYTSRIWSWTERGAAILALTGILKNKYWNSFHLFLSLVLGAVCFIVLYFTVNFPTAVSTSIPVIICFYGGCAFSRHDNPDDTTLNVTLSEGLKAILCGILLAVPFAIVNAAYFVITGDGFHPVNPLYAAMSALNPAISEEIIFRFTICGFCCMAIKGRVSARCFTVYSYILMVIPHSLIHLPDVLLTAPGQALFLFLVTCAIFGFPMAFLMKKKNLQTAAGFHWCIDFVRFVCGY